MENQSPKSNTPTEKRLSVHATGLPAEQVAGLAHDFKNLLSSVLGNLSLARREVHEPEALARLLFSAEKAASKAQDLAEALLTYAQHGVVVDTSTEEVSLLITDTTRFTLAGSSVELHLEVPEALGQVPLGGLAFTQVLQNLVINALQAMSGKGQLYIKAQALDGLANEPMAQSLPDGSYLRLDIRDTGPGIPADVMPRLFEQGFTTKKTGHGLGLSQVKRMVEEKGGTLLATSSAGMGTTFTLYLPLTPLNEPKPQAIKKTLELRKNRGRVLVLDDDELLRELAGEMLRTLGYDPEMVAQGEEALIRYQEARETGIPFESVILDLTVPGTLDGKAVLERLKAYDPQVKAILSTGHTHSPLVKSFEKHGFSGCVLKPYHLEDLSEALEQDAAASDISS